MNEAELRAKRNAYARVWMREHMRKPCLGGCGALVWTHMKGRTGYCIRCVKEREFGHNVRADTLRCTGCGEWKPDDAFYRATGRSAFVRRGRKSVCRKCENTSRREYRERNKVPCAGGCGTRVLAPNEQAATARSRGVTATGMCHECAMRLVVAPKKRAGKASAA